MSAATPARAPDATATRRGFGLLDALLSPLVRLWSGDLNLGRVGMAAAVPVLAWVFYTTSSGMIDIMQKEPGDIIGVVGTLIATTAVLDDAGLDLMVARRRSRGADRAAAHGARAHGHQDGRHRARVRLRLLDLGLLLLHLLLQQHLQALVAQDRRRDCSRWSSRPKCVLPATKQIDAAYDATVRAHRGDADLQSLSRLARRTDRRHAAGGAGAARRDPQKPGGAAGRDRAKPRDRPPPNSKARRRRAANSRDARREIATLDRSVADLEPIIKSKQDEIDCADRRRRARRSSSLSTPSTASTGSARPAAPIAARIATRPTKRRDASRRSAQTLAGPDE